MGPEMMRRFSEPAVAASVAAGLTPSEISRSHHEFYVFTVGCALTRSTFRDDEGIADHTRADLLELPHLSEHWENLVDGRAHHDLFAHGIGTLIASWDPDVRR